MSFNSISNVVDAPNRRSIKRYTIRVETGVTQGQIETPGYFRKYEFRGWQPGDIIEVLSDFGILGYEITGENPSTGGVTISGIYEFLNSAGSITAPAIGMSPVLASGPASGQASVQGALNAVNTATAAATATANSAAAAAAAITATSMVASIVANPVLVRQLWAAIAAAHFNFDGTTLRIDYNADGNVNA